MSIHVSLNHQSIYHYDRPVVHDPHLIRLRPAPHCRTEILSYSLKLSSKDHFLNWQQDPFGNYLARCVFPNPLESLKIEVDLIAKLAVHNPFDFYLEPSADQFPFKYEAWLAAELAPYLKLGQYGKKFDAFARSARRSKMSTVDFIVELNRKLNESIRYVIRMDPGVQTPEETLKKGSGSCRDSAWLLAQVFRSLGLASRFVSGYLIQLKPDVQSLDGPSGAASDFTDLHAWCEVYLPGAGWIGLDPTSGLLAGEGHIPVACTPEPSSAAPITGSTGVCEVEFKHLMHIERVHESPRVTLPYSEETWKVIQEQGETVDRKLKDLDVRLTMGGEPTFVSIDDMDGEEWHYTALGANKLRLAKDLISRLHGRLATGGLLHFGQGKWYPGESLPRWSLGCFWRKDGQPVWRDMQWMAWNEDDLGHGVNEADTFIQNLSKRLGFMGNTILPAHEDAWYYMWREGRLPINVDPLDSKLSDKEERQRISKIFNQGLDKIIGYVLPIRHCQNKGWDTGEWFLRRQHLFLIPGDSPIGYRLPMDSLPWIAPSSRTHIHPQDPFGQFAELDQSASGDLSQRSSMARHTPPHDLHRSNLLFQNQNSPGTGKPNQGSDPKNAWEEKEGSIDSGNVRTALCVEPRNGRIHVFMPPLSDCQQYLELIRHIEDTAAETGIPVLIEGETPPYHPSIHTLKVTPDPGVIEVNVPPAETWKDLTSITETVYEEARLSRLGTEKFLMDGRHVGTGGGNHVTLGGITPSDSPFLRRPDLLRSLVTYWQNHPSLSFLFSGLFIGPTSQHPRVDEARNDALYELNIACDLISEKDSTPSWLVDRIFRNLLVDVTGNTHRTEFCIDKLFSPESASGRLGLLEMRAFEMPPHARMSMVQQLLLRAILTRLCEHPYKQPFVRWNTQIHDRFMLPFFNQLDFKEVVEDLNAHGLDLQFDWFAPHIEFRFPKFGNMAHRGILLELSHALEPWHVLGEQGSLGGTSRYVDSSVERLQVTIQGMTDSRHIVCCNGRQVPLHPTGTQGEYVAGVRFRAWQPPECLHPTIGVQAPLTFDIVDTWNRRSIGGCTYHVGDPSGRNYETLPVNSYEAESRRLARFFKQGHTPGTFEAPPLEINRDLPLTLDLRTRPHQGK